MKTLRPALLAAAVLSLAACVPQTPYERFQSGEVLRGIAWKPGVTPTVATRQRTDCEVKAVNDVPANAQVRSTPSYAMPSQTVCNRVGGQAFCNTYGGGVQGGQTYSVDVNADLRQRVYRQCLADKGFQIVDLRPCPDGVTPQPQSDSQRLPRLGANACYRVYPNGLVGYLPG
ncbi:hypothetical protein DXV76_01750 [Rhodobacteraceae bacterium CCMM004]|nr:hypothetical protein DXV76_01750 [Rhodobacteraceae bacterium CCMM004]